MSSTMYAKPQNMNAFSVASIRSCTLFLLAAVLALLVSSVPARTLSELVDASLEVEEPTECILQKPVPHKPPAPTECPCGPTVMKEPYMGEYVVVVYEAWSGYCTRKPWVTSDEQNTSHPETELDAACPASRACCLSATYFVDGEKPKIREFTSCMGQQASLGDQSQDTAELEIQALPVDTSGRSTGSSAVQQTIDGQLDDPSDDVIDVDARSTNNDDLSNSDAALGSSSIHRTLQSLKGVFDATREVAVNLSVAFQASVPGEVLLDADMQVPVIPIVPKDVERHDHGDYNDYATKVQARSSEFKTQDKGDSSSQTRDFMGQGFTELSAVSASDDVVAMRLQAVVSVVVGLVGSIAISLLCFA